MHANYLSVGCNNTIRDMMIPIICKQLKPHLEKFDSIVAMGNSMMCVSPIIAHKLNKQLIIVRKDNEDCHSDIKVEYHENPGSYIIIDDLIASGRTITKIADRMRHETTGQLYGVYLYMLYVDELKFREGYHQNAISEYNRYNIGRLRNYTNELDVIFLQKHTTKAVFEKNEKLIPRRR